MNSKFKYYALMTLGICILMLFVSYAFIQSIDFVAFYKTGRDLIEAAPLYNLERDHGIVFKYPPWIAFLFVPFAFFNFETAKILWGVASSVAVFGIFYELQKLFILGLRSMILLAVFYFGLFSVNALDGQIVAFMLYPIVRQFRVRSILWSTLALVLGTTKIFTVFFTTFEFKKFYQSRVTLFSGVLMLGLSFIVSVRSFGGDFILVFTSWKNAALSGKYFLDDGLVTSHRNPSLSSLFSPDPEIAIGLFVLFFIIALGFTWWHFRGAQQNADGALPRISNFHLSLIGLAITPVLHPLPWLHMYLFTLPLSAALFAFFDARLCGERGAITGASAHENMGSSKKKQFIFFIFCMILIGLSSRKLLGPIGVFLELHYARMWGALMMVILSMWVFSRGNLSKKER